jgi:putative ABC transport system substrate-binding protein
MPAILRTTSTIPIVFNNIADPVGAGFVESLARPGGNATGFLQFEYTLSGKMVGTTQGDLATSEPRGGA